MVVTSDQIRPNEIRKQNYEYIVCLVGTVLVGMKQTLRTITQRRGTGVTGLVDKQHKKVWSSDRLFPPVLGVGLFESGTQVLPEHQ